MTYNAVGRSIIRYAQNGALRIATGFYKGSIIDHLYAEAEMINVKEHSEKRMKDTIHQISQTL